MGELKKSIFQKEISFGKPFSDKAKEEFYGEFNSLLESGIDIQRALSILIEEQEKQKILSILEQVRKDLIGGLSLSAALKKTKHFTPYEFQSIKIGEESGRLENILKHLANFYSNKVKLRRQLISVFTYPAFVLLITLGVLYFMLNSVVPMFEDVFKQFGQELPYLTRKIIVVSNYFSTVLMYGVLLFVGFGIYFYTQRKEVWFRKTSANIALKIPVFGSLLQKIYLARMCQSLSLLLSSKTPLVSALELVEDMIGFYPFEEALHKINAEVIKGDSLHAGFSKFAIFDKRLVSLTKIAEEINKLDSTFEKLADQYQEDIEYKTKLIGTVIEPLIIVLIGAIVGVIMVAMYMPMFNLSNVIK